MFIKIKIISYFKIDKFINKKLYLPPPNAAVYKRSRPAESFVPASWRCRIFQFFKTKNTKKRLLHNISLAWEAVR